MVVLVSDLHLADTPERSTLDVRYFVHWLDGIVQRAEGNGVKDLRLILLGDIFEILKSKKWIEEKVRPWEEVLPKHVSTVEAIFRSIHNSNEEFFSGLSKLKDDHPIVRIDYIPGNHDLPLNTDMGQSARLLLQNSLPLQLEEGETFGNLIVDEQHKLIAKHGHEWDRTNRYTREGKVAIGDAIVIEVLVQLPRLAAKQLNIAEDDPAIEFWHQLDNVRPQAPRTMAHWILGGLSRIQDSHPKAMDQMQDVFHGIAKRLISLKKDVQFEALETVAWWIKFLSGGVPTALRWIGFFRAVRLLPSGGEDSSHFPIFSLDDFNITNDNKGDYRYVVCGHTHVPDLATIYFPDKRGGQTFLYLNTGTWRKVHRAASVTEKKSRLTGFSSWDEECSISIYSEEEQAGGLPAYEFHRITRGIQL